MRVLLYPFMAIASLVFMLLTWLLAPLLALTSSPTGYLPLWLSWFQTFDASMDEGRQPQYGFTGSDWWVRTRWLWRNPGYTFDYDPLGIVFYPDEWRVIKFSDVDGITSFFALAPGAFNYEYGGRFISLKFGWKAWNYFDAASGTFRTTAWGPAMRAPLCITMSVKR